MQQRGWQRNHLMIPSNKLHRYILKHQNDDGGWPLIPGGESDVEVTAFAMQALMLKGWGSGSSVIRQGVSFLIKNQKSDGSWNGNAAHTIFAAIALKRAEAVEYWEAQFNALKWLEEAQREVEAGVVKSANLAIRSIRGLF